MSGLNKDTIVFDPADPTVSDDIGAYIRSSDGTLITHTNVGGKNGLDVNVLNDIAITATDLDIRNLDYTQDNVAIKGSTGNQLAINADGSINANVDVSVTSGSDKAEDAASASGDIGTYVLSVREDTLATSTSASGDYQSMKTDALGRLYVNDSHQSMLVTAASVATTAAALVVSSLANRKQILIQNISTKNVYLDTADTVTDSTGFKLGAGMSLELDLAAAVTLYAIAVGASADVRIIELA